MTKRTAPADAAAEAARPSRWAVALLVASTSFALVSITLLTTGFGLT